MSRPVLSTHILDTSTGRPASGVFIELYKRKDDNWMIWHSTMTNADGRSQFPFTKDSMSEGTYKLHFKVGDYYKAADKDTFFPFVEVIVMGKVEGKRRVGRRRKSWLRNIREWTGAACVEQLMRLAKNKKEQIVFSVKEGEHYHVPLLLSPYGYSTYRGS